MRTEIGSRVWRGLGLGFTAFRCTAPAHAQQYPTRAVRMLVGYAAGGGMDALSWVIAAR